MGCGGAFGLDAEVLAGIAEVAGLVAGAVVGKDAADTDAELRKPGDGGVEEVGRRGLLLVGILGIHGGEGDAGVVVDGDLQELGPDAPDGVAAVAGDAMGRLFDLD